MDRRAENAPGSPRGSASEPYRKSAGAAVARLRHRHRARRPSGDARLARQRPRQPRRGARRRAVRPDRHRSATSTATTASTPTPSSMRRKASPSARRCGTGRWRCDVVPAKAGPIRGARLWQAGGGFQTCRRWLWAPLRRRRTPCPPPTPAPIFRAARIAAPRIWRVPNPPAFVQGCLPNASVPNPYAPRVKEVSDGQSHAILHRRRLGRPGRQEVHPSRQSGDGRGDVRGCTRLQGRSRQGGRRRQARL